MKKIFQAAALLIMAASSIMAAATSRHSRANNHFPNEWESSYSSSDSFSQLQMIKYSTIKK